jgi:hypothetical protein
VNGRARFPDAALDPLRFFGGRGNVDELLRVLTDGATEYCGYPERHAYELYLAVEIGARLRENMDLSCEKGPARHRVATGRLDDIGLVNGLLNGPAFSLLAAANTRAER